MIRKLILFALVALIIIGAGSVWHYQQQHENIVKSPTLIPVAVKVAKVESNTIPKQILSIGVLKAIQEINITPEIAGQIVAINYQPGTFVQKGTVLFQLDDRIYHAQLKSAQAALQLAQNNYQRYQKLMKFGAQSKQALDQMRAAFIEASAAVKTNQIYLSETQITAPFSGYVGARNISVGDYVQVGEALTTLTDRSQLLVEYQLPEKFLASLKLKQPVTLIVSKHNHEIYLGKVSYIAPTINVTTHSVTVQANLSNPQNRLTPGLLVHVVHTIGLARHALIIPLESLVPTITGAKVFIVVNGKAQAVNVKTGITFANKVEIIKGLKLGNLVVTAGQEQLRDGAAVREVNLP